MKLRQLFENIYEEQPGEYDGGLKVIGVCFGRFNPPHRGHKAVWQAAATNPIWYVGTNQSTSGPKDPLPYEVKLQCMQAVWPKVAGHVIPEQSLLTLASRIYEEHGANVHLKVYTDEDWLVKTLSQYNGVEKEHGMYKFQQIDHVRTQRLASATNLRAAVRAGDRASFYKDMGIKPSVTVEVNGQEHPVFDVVAYFLNKYPEKTKKAVVAESSLNEYGDTAKGQKMLTKVQKRAVDRVTSKKADTDPKYAKKNSDTANRAWERMSDKDLEEHNFLESYFEDRALAILEATQQHISKRKQQSTTGLNTFGDGEHVSGDYTSYRLGLAVAGANGKDPIDMKGKSWVGKKKTTHPYTQEEQDMLKQAYKAVGAEYQDVNKGDMKSRELDDTHKVSPVAGQKRNKYGV